MLFFIIGQIVDRLLYQKLKKRFVEDTLANFYLTGLCNGMNTSSARNNRQLESLSNWLKSFTNDHCDDLKMFCILSALVLYFCSCSVVYVHLIFCFR